MLDLEKIAEYARLDQTHMLLAEEKQQIADAIELLARRYAVYGFNTGDEEYSRTHTDKPDATAQRLDTAIKLAKIGLQEWDVTCVMDRMTDTQVWDSEALNRASEKLVEMTVEPYTSAWDLYNRGGITMQQYRLLKDQPWSVLSAIVNADNAKVNLKTYLDHLCS